MVLAVSATPKICLKREGFNKLSKSSLILLIEMCIRDSFNPKSHEPDIHKAVRLCDMHNIPLATNIATAELLIKSLNRGDLEWREIYKN